MARPPTKPLVTTPDEVVISREKLRQLEKDSVLLKAVRDAGYLSGQYEKAVLQIATMEYRWHLM